MRALTDTWTMTKRSLRHTTRSVDTIITVVLMPIALLLLFVDVFGGAIGTQTGAIDYVDFITPAVVIMTVVTGISYAAVRLSTDLQKGIISRFRTVPVAPSSVLSGQALSSTLSVLFSCLLVVVVAFLVGFRPDADLAAWGWFFALLVLFTLATTAGHVLRSAGKDGRRRRRLQLPPAADLPQPFLRPRRLDHAMAERLR
jgi:ABC-2 type transport system permease protein